MISLRVETFGRAEMDLYATWNEKEPCRRARAVKRSTLKAVFEEAT
jgi:hypothetical protein